MSVAMAGKTKGKARLGGVLDWFRRRPSEEKPRSIFEAFGAKPPTPPATPLPGLPAPAGGTLVPRPETPPVPARPSIFQFAAPEAGPLIPQPPRIFEVFQPSPPPAAAEAQRPLWEPIYAPPSEAERPLSAMFAQVPETPQVEEAPRWRPGEYERGVPAWSFTRWSMPSTVEIVNELPQDWDLNYLWDYILTETQSPWWRTQVEQSPHVGEPATLELQLLARRNALYEDFAKLFGIPQQVLDVYFGNVRSNEDAREASYYFMEEVILPLIERYEKALDILRPAPQYMRGYFEIMPERETGNWWLNYKEGRQYPQLGRR